MLLFVSQTGYSQKHVSIGTYRAGIAFGNTEHYSGLRLNLVDKDYATKQNGVMLTGCNKVYTFNGFNFSIVSINEPVSARIDHSVTYFNGVNISLVNINGGLRGFQFGLYNKALSFDGKGVLFGLINYHSYGNRCMCRAIHKGLEIGFINVGFSTRGLKLGVFNVKGTSSVALGLVNCNYIAGLQIGLFNCVKKDKGVQIGVLNYRKSNRKIFRLLPLINF
jgi:hypothetical protein